MDVHPKNELEAVTPTKTVGDPDSVAYLQPGAIVPFMISVDVASPALPYESFMIQDSLSEGLTFDSWGTITIGETPLETPADYTISTDNSTVTASGLEKLNDGAAEYANGTTVTAIIYARVTGLGQIANTATVTINGETGTTPAVTTNWARLDITKVDEGNANQVLAGAEFELYPGDRTTLLATGTNDANGELSFIVWVGNDADTTEVVHLKETVAPEGYVIPADPWIGEYLLTAGADVAASIESVTIDNYRPEGPDLPLTGAQGTMLMSVGGLVLVGFGGGALALSRRRKSE